MNHSNLTGDSMPTLSKPFAKIVLLEHTPNADHLVSKAAKQCYSEESVGDTYQNINALTDAALITKVINMGHLSVLEHASFTFAISGISRACSHQLVRFRVASFSQQSQRYCIPGEQFKFVVPPTIGADVELGTQFNIFMNQCSDFYNYLASKGIPAEDARFVLPNAAETKLVMTMNARELHHAFSLRCCTHAQWEIREMFNTIRKIVKEAAPTIFAKCGASCEVFGICPEGARSCGKLN
jgi:thymidylate synthase (FAD)